MPQVRMTKQRAVILEALRSVTSHPTADEIYTMVKEKLPRISLGTVYRNLDLLSSSKEIKKLDRAGLQMRFDGNTAPHQHVRCERCGSIGDLFLPLEVTMPSPTDVSNFTIHSAEVEFLGICHNCKKTTQ